MGDGFLTTISTGAVVLLYYAKRGFETGPKTKHPVTHGLHRPLNLQKIVLAFAHPYCTATTRIAHHAMHYCPCTIANAKCPIAKPLPTPIANAKCPIANAKCPIANAKCPINVPLQMPNAPLMSHCKCQLPNASHVLHYSSKLHDRQLADARQCHNSRNSPSKCLLGIFLEWHH